MNKLIVTANPSEKGFTHKISMKYKEVSEQNGDTVEILDLYKTDLKQGFLTYENKSDIKNDPTTQAIQSKITWADEITLVFPIWWADAPAIMKNFIDCNFTSGFGFKVIDGKPTGLLVGKVAKVFATCGAPSFVYRFFPINFKLLWGTLRLGYCGIKLKNIEIFGGIETKTEEQKMKLLEKVK